MTPTQATSVQRPVAGSQRPAVRDGIRGIVVGAARTAGSLGAFGVSQFAGDRRTRPRTCDRPPLRNGGHANRGDTSSRPPFGHAAMALVHRTVPVRGARRSTKGRWAGPGNTWMWHSMVPTATCPPVPLVAVCAHGKHDQCCAVRGRAATAAIAARYPEFTWECSHLGGDRFAATMLVLPEGLCYGRVDSTEAAELVRLYLDGRLDKRSCEDAPPFRTRCRPRNTSRARCPAKTASTPFAP